MKSAVAVFSAIIGAIVLFTFLSGGGFSIGTQSGKPFLSLGYQHA